MTADQSNHAPGPSVAAVEDDAVRICRDLLAIDSSNFGDGSGPGERAAAEYVMTQLTEVGLEPVLLESAPGRANVVLRLPGADDERPGLAVHGHLDVVPADAADWQVPPFAAVEQDGYLWGRGAVDMKGMDAMVLACVREFARTGSHPSRPLTIAFFADEEAGGRFGSHWMAGHHAHWFEGVTEAISEVGGYSATVPAAGGGDARIYLLQTAEKGIAWLRLHAMGKAGHGSIPWQENAIVRLARALDRIDAHPWPREYLASVRQLFDGLSQVTGVPWSEADPGPVLRQLGTAAGFVTGSLQDTANPTMLQAGYKMNVIPQRASASLDCRFLPGHEEHLMATVRELAGEHVEVEVEHRDVALDAPFDADIVAAMIASLRAEDPDATVLPYCLTGGTDNKALHRLGIRGYGFAPLQLPRDLDFVALFHGVDERVPLDALRFGTRVLRRFLRGS